eukprot:TRINITY_DN26235_c0_g1_i1.p1 TRINITY_DN26235_c0_g1~~TRINITY_DN26235_c0_g1_i1.p1  ORF type:complete len:350 (+),score=76.66 TRINITY_DN26235_c0_g1_i1:41-1090(+)
MAVLGDSILPYKRIRTDGSISMCGLFFMGNAAREAGIARNIAKETISATGDLPKAEQWPKHCGDEIVETVQSLASIAIKQCEKTGGLELIVSSLNQLLAEYNGAVEQARHYYTLSRSDASEVTRYRNEAAMVPGMLQKLFNQAEAEKRELQKRVAALQEELREERVERTDSSVGKGRKVQMAQGSLRGQGVSNGTKEPVHAPRSPTGSPPLPSRQRPHSTIGWIKGPRGGGTTPPITLPRRPYSSLDSTGDGSYSLGNVPRAPYTSRITRAFTSSADIRKVFDELDTNKTGALSYKTVRAFYKSIDDFGVPKTEAQITDLLNRCSIRGARDERMTYPEFELLCLGVTRR